jgi:hypothetical protein
VNGSDDRRARAVRTLRSAADGELRPDWGFICLALARTDHAAAVAALRRVLLDPPPTPPLPLLGSAAFKLAVDAGEGGAELLNSLWPPLTAYQHQFHAGSGLAVVPGTTVATVGLNSLLIQSDRDLAGAAGVVGYNPRPFEAWALDAAEAVNRELWNSPGERYERLDVATGERRPAGAVEQAAALYAAIADRSRADRIAEHLAHVEMTPGTAPDASTLLNMWMAVQGLEQYGFGSMSSRLAAHALELAQSEAADPIASAALLVELECRVP